MSEYAQEIVNALEAMITQEGISKMQQGNLKELVPQYHDLLVAYHVLSNEEKDSIFKEVRKQRPFIGRRLREQFDEDLKNQENSPI